MSSFRIQFPGFEWWWIPLIFGLAGLLFYAFKTKNEPENLKIRKSLIILRSLIFILLSGLILRPEIHWISVEKKAPTASIWIDNSVSLSAQENFSKDSLLAMIASLGEALYAGGIRPQFFLFDENIKPISNKLRNINFDGDATDIALVLHKMAAESVEENRVGAFIISDGVVTRGEDPAFMDYAIAYPVFTIGIGDSNRILDPAVVKIELPLTTRVGDTVMVQAEVIPAGNGEQLEIILKSGDKIVQKQTVASQLSPMKKMVSFQFIPHKAGEEAISIEIGGAQDKNPYNNLRMSILKVVESATRVLIVSGQPNFEARFLTNTFRSLKDFEVYNIIENNGKWLPSNHSDALSKELNLIVFIGYPNQFSNSYNLLALKRKIADSRLPVMLFLDGGLDLKQIETLLGWNPIAGYILNKNMEPITVQCANETAHPVVTNWQKGKLTGEIIANLPPIGTAYKKIRMAPAFETLIVSNDLAANPVIAVSSEATKRLAVCSGTDFWRWTFMTQEIGSIDVYQELFQYMAKWLTDSLDTSPIQFSVNKKFFLNGETIEVNGLLRDLKGILINNAKMQAELISDDAVTATSGLIWNGEHYTGSLPVKNAGEKLVRISAFRDEKNVGFREQMITVLDRPVEFMEVRQNADLLRMIALNTGGIKTNPGKAVEIVSQLKPAEKIIRNNHIVKILRWKWALIVLISLLTIEWSIRRFHGYQ